MLGSFSHIRILRLRTITAYTKRTGNYYISSNPEVELPADLMKAENFIGFDFDDVWVMPESGDYLYPKLRNNWQATEEEPNPPGDPEQFEPYTYRAQKLQDMTLPYVRTIEETLAEDTPCDEMVEVLQQSGFDEAAKVWQSFSLVSDTVDDVTALYDFAASPQDMYSAIILNALQASVEYDLIASEYEKGMKLCKDFVSTVNRDMQAKYTIDLSDPEAFSKLTDAQKNDFNKYVKDYFKEKQPDLSDLGEVFEGVTTGIKTVGSVEDFYERVMACAVVFKANGYMQQVLERAYLDSRSMDNVYLRLALLDCVEIINSSTEELATKVVMDELTIVGVDAAKYLIKEVLWDQVSSALYTAHPAIAVFQAAYKSGKYVSNLLFSTDDSIEQYMYMLATLDIEDLINETYSALRSDFVSAQSVTTAGIYLSALDLVFHIREEDCKQAYDFVDILDQSLVNWIASLFGQSDFDGTKDYLNMRQKKYAVEHESALTNWINYLEEDYPNSGLYEQYQDALENSLNRLGGKEFIAACPVDVYVFDETQKLAASIVDGKVLTTGNITAGIVDDKKIIRFYGDQDYRVQYIGNDTGEMDITITEFSASGQSVRTVNFYDVALQDQLTYNMDAEQENLQPAAYVLTNESAGMSDSPDYDSLQEAESYQVSVQSGSMLKDGEIYLSTEAAAGEQLELHAYIPENYKFVRWEASNGENIFADMYAASTSCIMPAEDIVVRAIIEMIPSEESVPVESIAFDQNTVTLNSLGASAQLKVLISPDTATDQTVIWHSDNPEVVSVDDGIIKAISEGRTTITATTMDGGLKATCAVSVIGQNNTGAGSGGSSSVSSGAGSSDGNAISVISADNGTAIVSPKHASKGATVTITVTPDEGYELDTLTVTDTSGNRISLTNAGNGKYTFTMPSSRVTVNATFTEVEDAPEQVGSFTDVHANDWFADAVQYMLDNGMMNGTSATTFSPNATTIRSMIVTILHRLENEPSASAFGFTDVVSGAYYTNAVNWAAANDIVNGVSATSFAPNDPITREQMAAILYRYAQFKGYDVTASNNLSSYADASQVSTYATTAMQWANAEELITGVTSTTLEPQGSATRAQVATILVRFCENIAK